MKIKNSEVGGYISLLEQAEQSGAQWAYAVSKNRKRLRAKFEQLQKHYNTTFDKKLKDINRGLNPKERIAPLDYQRKSIKLIEKHSWYDDEVTIKVDGKDTLEKKQKQFLDSHGRPSVYSKNVEKYKEEAELLDKEMVREKEFLHSFNQDFDKYLDKEFEFDFHLVDKNGIPEDVNASFLEQFDFMIKD